MDTLKNKNNIVDVIRKKLYAYHFRFYILHKAVNIFLAFLSGISVCILTFLLNPESILLSFISALATLAVSLFLTHDLKIKKTPEENILLALDIKFPEANQSVYDRQNWNTKKFKKDWENKLKDIQIEIRNFELNRLLKKILFTIPLIFISFFLLYFYGEEVLKSAKNLAFAMSDSRIKLEVLEGALENSTGESIILDPSSSLPFRLAPRNLISVDVLSRSQTKAPYLTLNKEKKDKKALQSYQMNEYKEKGITKYRLQFEAAESAYLTLHDDSQEKIIANFVIQEPDGPKVELKALHPIPPQWLDDRPLGLDIVVHSKTPLSTINLIINIEGRRYTENIYDNNLKGEYAFHTQTYLVLNKYVENDFSNVEIRAQAIDNSEPKPLVGYSQPIVIQTVSSYGKYRKILSDLRSYKENVDTALSKMSTKLSDENEKIIENAKSDANESPFFDSSDRGRLENMQQELARYLKYPDIKSLYQISQNLGRFLHEHEMLDDRERDNDFYVAARIYSRLIEEGSPSLKVAGEKIQEFLKERQRRWEIRVSRLENPRVLKRVERVVKGHYIYKQFEKVRQEASQAPRKQEALKTLADLVSFYKQWTDELEKQEDKERLERESKRDKGLLSALETLKQLQKQQLEVSKNLHGADLRTPEDLDKVWPIARLHQNTNIEDTKKLAAFLNMMSPRSAERLNAAAEAMNLTVQNGEAKNYVQAESFADLASRLLHQASKMTEEDRKNIRKAFRGNPGNYYGQPVVGGDLDIEHEYKVNPRYREEVLDEVLKSEFQGDNQIILNNFLKRIIR